MTKYLITRRNGVQHEVLLSDEDYERVVQAGPWFVNMPSHSQTIYAQRNVVVNGVHTTQSMHRFLTNEPPGLQVDHRNGHGLDNQQNNLRVATNKENTRNAPLRRDSTSGLKGVSWDKDHSKWSAHIRLNGRLIKLGRFKDKAQAHAAYCAAAHRLFGEFARTA